MIFLFYINPTKKNKYVKQTRIHMLHLFVCAFFSKLNIY